MKKYYIIAAGIPVFILTGWFFLGALTVHPTGIFMQTFIFTVILCLAIAVSVVAAQKKKLLLSLLSGFVFFMAGYLIHAKIYLSEEDSRLVPEITRQPGPGKGHTGRKVIPPPCSTSRFWMTSPARMQQSSER
jgi:hypothetical protein